MTFTTTISRVTRRIALAAGLLCGAALVSPSLALAQDFPSRSVTLILPFPAGSTSDTITRILQSHLSRRLGVPVVVENRAGASGDIAYSHVAAAKPDGHTLLLTPDAVVISPLLKNQGIDDVFKRLTPVTIVAEAPLTFIIPRALPVTNLKEFVDYAKARPGKLNFASSGVGSVPFLSVAYLAQRTGIDMTHVPYRGAAQSMNAMFGGEVQLFLGDINRYMDYQDKLRALVVTGSKRDPRLPDVPTLAEAGYPGQGFGLWLGLFAPAGTPAPLLTRLNSELSAVMASPEFQAQMRHNGYESNPRSTQDTARFVRSGFDFWRKVVVDGKLNFVP